MKQRYLIDYENAHWCGGQLNVVVWAEDELDAEMIAADHMEEEQRELFYNEYGESDEYDDEQAYSVKSVTLLDEKHDQWKYYIDPSQKSFYPEIE